MSGYTDIIQSEKPPRFNLHFSDIPSKTSAVKEKTHIKYNRRCNECEQGGLFSQFFILRISLDKKLKVDRQSTNATGFSENFSV